jgi:two-component SAPR family response regulator
MIDLAEQKYAQVIGELENNHNDDASVLYILAKACQGGGNLSAAQKYFKRILTLNELNSLEYALVRHKAEKELLQVEEELLAVPLTNK